MGVKTIKELKGKGAQAKAVKADETSIEDAGKAEKKGEAVYRVFFPRAPKGKCNASYLENGETKSVILKDGFYVFKDKEEKRAKVKAMINAGFVDADYMLNQKRAIIGKKKVNYNVRYAHPDNEPDHKKKGFCSVEVKGVTWEFDLDDYGSVWTDDPKKQKVLQDLKWAEVGRIEIKDSK